MLNFGYAIFRDNDVLDHTDFLEKFIFSSLHCSINTPNLSSRSHENFRRIFFQLFGRKKEPVYYNETVRKRFSIEVNEIMPFLQYFIEFCDTEYAKDMMKNATYCVPENDRYIVPPLIIADDILDTAKESVIKHRNSLLIMNHFKKPTAEPERPILAADRKSYVEDP